jgi:NitT/TauT family transport system substrate-binding protein
MIARLGLALIFSLIAAATANPQTRRMAVAYSAISGTQTAFYLAADAGLFDKHDLHVDPVYVASGTKVTQAMLAGEFPVALAGGIVVNAILAGSDLVFIGGVVNVPAFYLIVQPSIKKPEDLRGKALGVTSYGSSTDFTVRYLLKKWGVEPDKDVKILQMGGQPEILAGLMAGAINGGVFTSPGEYRARKAGNVIIADFSKIGLDYPTVSLVSTRAFIKKEPATIRRFLMGYSDGVERMFRDKELAMKIISKYTRNTDREVLEATYTYATNFVERPPRPPVKAVETILEQTAVTNPKAKGRRAEEFVDPSFYNELEKSGYFKSAGK